MASLVNKKSGQCYSDFYVKCINWLNSWFWAFRDISLQAQSPNPMYMYAEPFAIFRYLYPSIRHGKSNDTPPIRERCFFVLCKNVQMTTSFFDWMKNVPFYGTFTFWSMFSAPIGITQFPWLEAFMIFLFGKGYRR